jgi:hypothetical protein
MSRQRKRDAVLRLLRGDDLDTVSRALGDTAATLSGFVAGLGSVLRIRCTATALKTLKSIVAA